MLSEPEGCSSILDNWNQRWPNFRDELMLKVELKSEEGIDTRELDEQLIKVVTEAVRIKLDRVEYVVKGTIPEAHKLIVDQRIY
jgi:hypothetical protein